MSPDFERFIDDSAYRKSFFETLDKIISTLRKGRHFEAMEKHCLIREKLESHVRRLRLDHDA